MESITFRLESIEISNYQHGADRWERTGVETGRVHLLKFTQVGNGLVVPELGFVECWPQGRLELALDSAAAARFEIGVKYYLAELECGVPVTIG